MFKRNTTPAETQQPVQSVERITSVLGSGVIWHGSINGSGGVRIEGAFEGEIALRGMLVVGELSLDGTLRHTRGVLPMAATARQHGFRHTAVMYSKNLDHLSRMARVMDCSIFVKNAPSLAGLGAGGEGFCSFSIASPTGEGITSPISFSRIRRCTLKDAFRIV